MLVLVLGAAACGGDDDPTVAGSTSSSSSSSSTSTTSTTEADAPSTTSAPASDAGLVWIEPTGLSVLEADGSVTARLTFGETARDQVVSGLDEHLGVAGVATDLEECGEGPMEAVRYPGLSTYFQDDLFAGWFLDDSPESEVFRTPDDIGIGSTKQDLDEAFGGEVSVEETSLGLEWMSSTGFSGTLTEEGLQGEVDHLWAGQACIAR